MDLKGFNQRLMGMLEKQLANRAAQQSQQKPIDSYKNTGREDAERKRQADLQERQMRINEQNSLYERHGFGKGDERKHELAKINAQGQWNQSAIGETGNQTRLNQGQVIAGQHTAIGLTGEEQRKNATQLADLQKAGQQQGYSPTDLANIAGTLYKSAAEMFPNDPEKAEAFVQSGFDNMKGMVAKPNQDIAAGLLGILEGKGSPPPATGTEIPPPAIIDRPPPIAPAESVMEPPQHQVFQNRNAMIEKRKDDFYRNPIQGLRNFSTRGSRAKLPEFLGIGN